ncbi:MAG: glycoside hydrolase family 3 protein [Cyanobacteria bacterium HKST-UBA04]|nr:glycoside hydrolase family 3 protein [Cyanobacteria bacterium HKST-UBA04]MCA9840988.1 glycoside hydrolase family 3 protein [Cyanobacteria bacterium HKST-UBA03]
MSEAKPLTLHDLSTEQRLALCFMVGSDSEAIADELEPFFGTGLGGVLWFRHHFNHIDTAQDCRAYMADLRGRFGPNPLGFMGVDQEGGQVERLPHWFFPTGCTALSYGRSRQLDLCRTVAEETARRLRWLGFNLNFAPTVDLNREQANPIIGVRAYGETVEAVMPFAQAVMAAHVQAGVLPVAKHFPGHGSGTVDSHLDLPVFGNWQPDELDPYTELIHNHDPALGAVLVAHGLYPALCERLGVDPSVVSSMNPGIIVQLLRDELGFGNGLVFSDDMTMGAIGKHTDPEEAALHVLDAGCDVLVYRQAQPLAWQVYSALLKRLRQGKLDEQRINEKAQRVWQTIQTLGAVDRPSFDEAALSKTYCHDLALGWAKQAMAEQHHYVPSPLPLSHKKTWALVAPNQLDMVHYRDDLRQAPPLEGWLTQAGLKPAMHFNYPLPGVSRQREPDGGSGSQWPVWAEHPLDALVFVAFNALLDEAQQRYYQRLVEAHPATKVVLVSVGMPTDGQVLVSGQSQTGMMGPWVHLCLPSYRPASQHALAQWLGAPPKGFESLSMAETTG